MRSNSNISHQKLEAVVIRASNYLSEWLAMRVNGHWHQFQMGVCFLGGNDLISGETIAQLEVLQMPIDARLTT
jgi:hypothetical protein